MTAPLVMAREALASGDARSALALAERHARPGHLPWTMLCARALMEMGDAAAAEARLRAAGDAWPARWLLCRLLITVGRAEEVLGELPPDGVDALLVRLTALRALGRFAEARAHLDTAIPLAIRPRVLEQVFLQAGPVLGHGPAHEAATRRIAAQLAALPPDAPGTPEAEAAPRLRARLDFTLGDRVAFRQSATAALEAAAGGGLATILAAALDAPAKPRPRVFVVGLSKTGTSSMDEAFGRLGLVHAHWAQPLSNLVLRPSDSAILEAMSDAPVADAVEVLAATHADARFILTLRPLESWLDSFTAHYRRLHGAPDMATMRAIIEAPDRTPHGDTWRRLHHNLYTRHPDFPTAFAAHTARVEAVFRDAPNRLLHFDAVSGDGYPKLCAFLGLPVPHEAFPHSNAAPKIAAEA